MIPWELLDEAPVPGGPQRLSLHRRGEELSIRVDGRELMNSRRHDSEEALARLSCEPLARCAHARVLIGGLGMGYTLAAALRALGPGAEVVVAELVPAVVAWNRGVLGPVAGHPLRDARVAVREVDVAVVMHEEPGGFDAVLLDTDNGPDALTCGANESLYGERGLSLARAALRPQGALWVWSAGSHAGFLQRLRGAGLRATEHAVHDRPGRKGARHVVWEARR